MTRAIPTKMKSAVRLIAAAAALFTVASCSILTATPDTPDEQVAATAQAASTTALTSTNLELQVAEQACYANGAQETFEATNGSAAAIPLSSISIQYWIFDTSGTNVQAQINYGGCITSSNGTCIHPVSGVTITTTPFTACGPSASQQANWEITVSTTDNTPLAPGQTWSNVQTAVNLANFKNFVPGSASWYSPCGSGEPYAANPNFGVSVGGNLVDTLGITAPSCRAPHGSQPLTGYVSILPPNLAPVLGPVDPSTPVSLDVGLPAQPGLKEFADAVSDPQSPLFRHYITDLTTFTEQFGASSNDYSQVIAWAAGAGFGIVYTFPNNLLVTVSGTAAQVEQALFANLVWRARSDGTRFIAVDREPSVNLTPTLLWISGLDDFTPLTHASGSGPAPGVGANHNYFGNDFRNAYFQDCLTVPSANPAGAPPLDGTGQTVGVLAFAHWDGNVGDVQGYDNAVNTVAMQNPDRGEATPLSISNVTTAGTFDVATGSSNGATDESIGDIEAVQSMAPGAQVLVFQGSISAEGHDDALYQGVATHTPFLSSATSSFLMGYSSNAQQAVWEMASEGISFFQSSGDWGNVGDPMDNLDMDAQTLVGGTILNTNPLLPGGPFAGLYPVPYYNNEQSWVDSNGASGGGSMDGANMCYAFGVCPNHFFLPPYQANVSMGTNGGSTMFRNYPDVAMNVYADQIFVGQVSAGAAGTSIATPLWAGVAALVDQRAAVLGGGKLGFANPPIYEIGLTRGSASDLYAASFHDIADNVVNDRSCGGSPPCFPFADVIGIPGTSCTCPPSPTVAGHPSVPGFDLVTGWGTPTCQLINQLSSKTPLTPDTVLNEAAVQIITGKDAVENPSSVSACVTFVGSSTCVPVGAGPDGVLKPAGGGGFDSGQIESFIMALPPGLNVTPSLIAAGLGGVQSITISLNEEDTNRDFDDDNWDIGAINIRLFNPGTAGEICQFDAEDTISQLANTDDPGVVRLSGITAGSSGSGPTVTLNVAGCVPTGSPLPAAPAQAQFIIATGSDSIRGNSGAMLQVFGSTPQGNADTSVPPFIQAGIPSGGQSGDVYNIVQPVPATAPPPAQWQVVLTLVTHNAFPQGDDHWDVGGLNVMTWSADGAEQCVVLAQGDPAVSQLLGSHTFPATPNCR